MKLDYEFPYKSLEEFLKENPTKGYKNNNDSYWCRIEITGFGDKFEDIVEDDVWGDYKSTFQLGLELRHKPVGEHDRLLKAEDITEAKLVLKYQLLRPFSHNVYRVIKDLDITKLEQSKNTQL